MPDTEKREEEEKVKVQFEFTLSALARLEAMKIVLGSPTRANVIRNALRVYEWVINEVLADDKLQIIHADGKTEEPFSGKLLLGDIGTATENNENTDIQL